jgi:hypothetical protein
MTNCEFSRLSFGSKVPQTNISIDPNLEDWFLLKVPSCNKFYESAGGFSKDSKSPRQFLEKGMTDEIHVQNPHASGSSSP